MADSYSITFGPPDFRGYTFYLGSYGKQSWVVEKLAKILLGVHFVDNYDEKFCDPAKFGDTLPEPRWLMHLGYPKGAPIQLANAPHFLGRILWAVFFGVYFIRVRRK